MNRTNLIEQINRKKSYLCVGLDSDINKIPEELQRFPDPVFEFNKRVIEATSDHCVAYKINTAFYESRGLAGWACLEKTVAAIPDTHFKIADAKRGDIGNTSRQYAKTFFGHMNFDAVTVSPYMGEDSVSPFLDFENKWVIILALTSNKGSDDFQQLSIQDKNERLFERVLKTCSRWGSEENIMFVVGATHPDAFLDIRKIIPRHFLLVPGVGAQGGDLGQLTKNAANDDTGILVNVSRGILFPQNNLDYPQNIREAAHAYHHQMSLLIQ